MTFKETVKTSKTFKSIHPDLLKNIKDSHIMKDESVKASKECQEANDREENFRVIKPFRGFTQ